MASVGGWDWLLLSGAAFVAGILNALAGGGSFITLPALIVVGVPPVAANATGTAALLPGYCASAWRLRHDLATPPALSFSAIIGLALVGGGAGAALLLVTGDALFAALIPWLLLAATALFAAGPFLLNAARSGQASRTACVLTLLGVCIYGGYFNGGLGIVLLAALGLLGQTNLIAMNGLKNLISALLTVIAVIVYAAGGAVTWPLAIGMMLAATIGGYAGALIAYALPQKLQRWAITAVGVAMTIAFFLKQYC